MNKVGLLDVHSSVARPSETNSTPSSAAKLSAGVAELHEMFLELAFLVEAQGDMVERIACSVTQAQEYTG